MSVLQERVWAGRLPLEIRLASSECRIYDQSDPYLISVPRLCYLPLLLPRLHAFFSPVLIADPTTTPIYDGYFTYDSVPLKWHLPIGLLYDIYVLSSSQDPATPPLPFKLILHFQNGSGLNLISAEPAVLHDAFINSVKEADFLRTGTAKPIMSLSAADSRALWGSVQSHDMATYKRIYNSLLPQNFRNIPIRIYLPSGPDGEKASIKVVQAHIPPTVNSTPSAAGGASRTSTTTQTLGSALRSLMPSLFPSSRTPVLARTVLHGAVVPLGSQLEELARNATYTDGWLGVVVVMNS
ncbi:Autophagy protein 5 [Endocarpon pusillum Z07020]|uniref:Autophagy protein 5 n=1 Tax=Endocarpon pusillum (strain Z07020 / HMAS-L-300199) TaxID=1263415 RepID=U1GHR0_ENDPU|nr:Autophagy protein 5 [Endocarpon pusillum Z07020]ERF71351.1 Autophagy protein 5 [Endocarpon pusillum Z07020]